MPNLSSRFTPDREWVFSTASVVLFLVLLVWAEPRFGSALAAGLPTAIDGAKVPSLAPMLERVTPAVVNVAARAPLQRGRISLFNDPFFRQFFGAPYEQDSRRDKGRSLGSGVIVDAQRGLLLTNHHVVHGAAEIIVTLRDGRRLPAKRVGTDPETDVAVLKITADDLVGLPMADSAKLRVGDFVVAIGNPFGLGQTVTSGIVSALGRRGLGIEGYEDFIQTDASINLGNSGGALVNLHGKLVGINTAILAPNGGSVGIGFAIPSNMASSIMEDLVQHGRVRRGALGIGTQDLTPNLAEAFRLKTGQGAVIVRLSEGSPAQAAGLRIGDVIVSVNGRSIENSSNLGNAIGLMRVGEEIELEVLRSGQSRVVTAKLIDREGRTVSGKTLHPRLKGTLFAETIRRRPDGVAYRGIQVVDVAPGTSAARAGLRTGDFVTGVNRRRVDGFEDLTRLARLDHRLILLTVWRADTRLLVLIE